MFDNGWLLPGYPPEFGGRNATLLQQYVHQQELARRRAYLTFNPQGVGIISASLISFGTPEQQHRWAVPILRAEITASLGMSETGAGSDLASLRTRGVRDGDDYVVNGQKVWTSGAHDADVLLTFVRTDPNAPKHKGISALMIPTDLPGVVRRPFASACDVDDLDFNEVFFNDVRVPVDNLIGPLNDGWRVASGSLGHERNMLWLSYADRLAELVEDFRPANVLDRDRYATLVIDNQALRLMGSMALARAARGDEDVAALSVLKLFGVGGVADRGRTRAERLRRCRPCSSGHLGPLHQFEPRRLRQWLVRTLRPLVRRHDRRRHVGNPTQHHCPAGAGLAQKLRNNRVYRL